MVSGAVLDWGDAACVENFPEAVGGVGVGVAEASRRETGVQADQDECEIWTKAVDEFGW